MTRPRPAPLLAATLAGTLLGALPAAAQQADYLVTSGPLSGEDFYRLVACRALPGGPCTTEPVRWPPARAADLVVGFASLPAGYPRATADRAAEAVDHAIAEINAAGAALHLRRAKPGEVPDIAIHLAAVGEGDVIQGTGVRGVDGQEIGAALVTVWWDEARHLTEAVVVLARNLPPADTVPVVLEELTQAMGLMTDIRNPAYDDLSVFSEDSNRVTALGALDREALRRHYPLPAP